MNNFANVLIILFFLLWISSTYIFVISVIISFESTQEWLEIPLVVSSSIILFFILWRLSPIEISSCSFLFFIFESWVLENLILCQYLVFWYIDLSKPFTIWSSILHFSNDISPFFIIRVDEILNLKSCSYLQKLTLSQFYKFLTNIISIVKVNNFCTFLLYLNRHSWAFDVISGLFAEVNH